MPSMVVNACNLSTREMEIGGYMVHWTVSCGKVQVPVRDLFLKSRWEDLEEQHLRVPSSFHTHIHTYEYIHIHKNTSTPT